MFEIFLFINPIGIYCYDTEKQIRKTVDELGVDVCYHYIPIANVCLINDDAIRRRKDDQKLPDISNFSRATYITTRLGWPMATKKPVNTCMNYKKT